MVNLNPPPGSTAYQLGFPARNDRVTDADKIRLIKYTKAKVCAALYTDPCGPGIPVKRPQNAMEVGEVTPPMIHEFDVIRPCEVDDNSYRIDPVTGEPVLRYEDRFERAFTESGTHLRDRLMARLHYDAAMIFRDGHYLVKGEESPTMLVDFQRDARLTQDLVASAGDTWNLSTSRPFSQLDQIASIMTQYGAGGGIIDVIMTPSAWAFFSLHHDAERAWLGAPRITTDVNTDPMAFEYMRYRGSAPGYRFWEINEKICEGGVTEDIFPDGSIVMINQAAFNGYTVYGSMKLPDGTLQRTAAWFDDFVNRQCQTRELHLRSRPLLIPANVNASAFLQVVDPTLPLSPICYDGCATVAP